MFKELLPGNGLPDYPLFFGAGGIRSKQEKRNYWRKGIKLLGEDIDEKDKKIMEQVCSLVV